MLNYLNVMLYSLSASLLVVFMNVYVLKHPGQGYVELFKIAAMFIPLQFLVSYFYLLYYSKGNETISFTVLIVLAYGTTMIVSFLAEYLFLKKQSINFIEMVGVIIIILGIGLVLYTKTQK